MIKLLFVARRAPSIILVLDPSTRNLTGSGYLGSNSQFDKAATRFAVAYAQQNERDYKALQKAIRDGRLQTFEE